MPTYLEQLEQEYEAKVTAYAQKRFNEIVLPWCRRHQYGFKTGNGTWFFRGPRHDIPDDIYMSDADDIPDYILEVMVEETILGPLAWFMDDFDPLTDAANEGDTYDPLQDLCTCGHTWDDHSDLSDECTLCNCNYFVAA